MLHRAAQEGAQARNGSSTRACGGPRATLVVAAGGYRSRHRTGHRSGLRRRRFPYGRCTPIAGSRAGPAPGPGSGPPRAHRTGVARPLGACATSRADRRPPGYQPERNSSSAAKSTTGSWVIASSSVSNAATLAAGKAARTAVKVRSMRGWGRSCHWTVMTTPDLLPVAACHPSLSSWPYRTRHLASFRSASSGRLRRVSRARARGTILEPEAPPEA